MSDQEITTNNTTAFFLQHRNKSPHLLSMTMYEVSRLRMNRFEKYPSESQTEEQTYIAKEYFCRHFGGDAFSLTIAAVGVMSQAD